MRILVTGGAGFIGSALIRFLMNHSNDEIINVDKLTYASNLAALDDLLNDQRYTFKQVDICAAESIKQILTEYRPDAIMHLAAESHVDRSIDSSSIFIQSNIVGTHTLLEASRAYWLSLSEEKKAYFRFHHISTDEVYGDLAEGGAFTEETPYAPSSPYSASKASSDHLVRAWQRTYGLPTLITNCSNNYGPFQYPEKLIPRTISNALLGKQIPIYGDGQQIRDWLYVEDHVRALNLVLKNGSIGETYNIGGNNEQTNVHLIHKICDLLEEIAPCKMGRYADLICYVPDRAGHDRRYAVDTSKIHRELNWAPQESFESGLRKTVQWYFEHLS